MTRKRIDTYNYWGPEHHALLVFCAKKSFWMFGLGDRISSTEIDELVNVGWLRTLRRRREDQLHGCGAYTICHMMEYLRYSATGVSDFKRKRYGTMTQVGEVPDTACTQLTPLEMAIAKEELKLMVQDGLPSQ